MILVVLASTLPALILLAFSVIIPGMPVGMALGAAISLPLLALGAVAAVLGLGSLNKPLDHGFGRALAGAGTGLVLRMGGVLTAAMVLGHDGAARVALATIAGCIFLGTVVETGLLLRALKKALPDNRPVRESIHA